LPIENKQKLSTGYSKLLTTLKEPVDYEEFFGMMNGKKLIDKKTIYSQKKVDKKMLGQSMSNFKNPRCLSPSM